MSCCMYVGGMVLVVLLLLAVSRMRVLMYYVVDIACYVSCVDGDSSVCGGSCGVGM